METRGWSYLLDPSYLVLVLLNRRMLAAVASVRKPIWPRFGSEASPMTPIDIRGVLKLGHEASTMALVYRWLFLLRQISALVMVVCLDLALVWSLHLRRLCTSVLGALRWLPSLIKSVLR
jgi:hypothetical protein